MVVALWACTIFLGSCLLFSVQPMIGKMLLPQLGGAPAVWTTSVLFFQGALLAGYAYAHWSGKLTPRKQLGSHVVLLLLPLGLLPFRLIDRSAAAPGPTLWLLEALSVAIGLPFLVLASGTPLLSRWLSWSNRPRARSPYFLYAFSNAGSLLALFAYPVAIEPWLGLARQEHFWAWGYFVYVMLALGCALVGASTGKARASRGPVVSANANPGGTSSPSLRRRLHWLVLAAVPSSLMLGVTAVVTDDVAAMPLLWVLPLGLYLLSFVLCFGGEAKPSTGFSRYLPVAAVVYMMLWLTRATEPVAVVTAAHLSVLFVAAMACHGELSRLRPDPDHLSSYYLMIALGGVAGGAFNTLLAPVVFDDWVEYPLAFTLACLLGSALRSSPAPVSAAGKGRRTTRPNAPIASSGMALSDVAIPAVLGLSTLLLVKVADHWTTSTQMRLALTAGLPVLMVYFVSKKPLRFALAVGMVLGAGSIDTFVRGQSLWTERNFFGVHRVTLVESSRAGRRVAFHHLYDGATIHGVQRAELASDRPTDPRHPLGYYSETSAIGRLFRALVPRETPERVAVVGLGTGSLLAYSEPGEHWTLFEIDPLVKRIAEDERYFTYLSDARERGVAIDVLLGDARVTLASRSSGRFDVLVLDAFNSDAIPVHLLTREAFLLYREKLAARGFLALHISNRHIDLGPIVEAAAADVGLAAFIEDEPRALPPSASEEGVLPSRWAILARDTRTLRAGGFPGASARPASGRIRLWTDDYSEVLSVFHW